VDEHLSWAGGKFMGGRLIKKGRMKELKGNHDQAYQTEGPEEKRIQFLPVVHDKIA
jgi:hypothetical protein